jgi:hypothetical protein
MIERTDVESYLIGYLPYFAAVDATVMEAAYIKAIAKARDDLAGALQCCFEPTIVKMKPSADLVRGWGDDADYQIEDPALNFTQGAMDRNTLPVWTLYHRPVISVQSMRFMIGSRNIYTIPAGWLQVDKVLGTVSLLPDGATAAALSTSAPLYWVPLLDGGMWRWRIIPQFVAIDYTAGWEDFDNDPDTQKLREMLAQCAAADVLKRTERLIPATVNLDGFTQAFVPVDQQLKTWKEEREDFIRKWRAKYLPPIMRVI